MALKLFNLILIILLKLCSEKSRKQRKWLRSDITYKTKAILKMVTLNWKIKVVKYLMLNKGVKTFQDLLLIKTETLLHYKFRQQTMTES